MNTYQEIEEPTELFNEHEHLNQRGAWAVAVANRKDAISILICKF